MAATYEENPPAVLKMPSENLDMEVQRGRPSTSSGTQRVKEAWAQVTVWKRSFMCILVLLTVQQAMMFGTVWWATETVKEVHISNSKLTDNDGKAVSAVNQYQIIDGVKFDGALKIPRCLYDSTHAGFFDGKTEWIVPLPEGSTRHVSVEGAALRRAWGVDVDHTEGDVKWTATCPDDVFEDCSSAEDCSIEWSYVDQQNERRLDRALNNGRRLKGCGGWGSKC